jgi:hypothetical protein
VITDGRQYYYEGTQDKKSNSIIAKERGDRELHQPFFSQ